MDRGFMNVVAVGIILIAVAAVVSACVTNDANMKVACIGIVSTAVGVLGGVLNAPRFQQQIPTNAVQPEPSKE